MLWIYIALAGLILSVPVSLLMYSKRGYYDRHETIWSYMGSGFIISLICGVVITIMGNVISSKFVGNHWEQHSSTELVSLGDSNAPGGSFFLGSGTIENSPVYSYYVRSGDGYVLKWKKADNSTIYQQTGTPRLDIMVAESNNPFYYIGSGNYHYNFVVPPGSIKEVFNLDAQ